MAYSGIFDGAHPTEMLERKRVAEQSAVRVRHICRDLKIRETHLRHKDAGRKHLKKVDELKLEVGLTVRQQGTDALYVIRRIDNCGAKSPPVVYVHGSRHPINPLTLERA